MAQVLAEKNAVVLPQALSVLEAKASVGLVQAG